MLHTINGRFGQHYDALLLDGELLDPGPSQKIRNHSPDGFSWGYGGSGPAQTALGILLAVTGDPEISQRHYQDFKNEFVAKWPQDSFLVEVDVEEWLAQKIFADREESPV